MSFVVQLLFTVPLSFTLAWVFNGSGESVLIAVLMHGAINGTNAFLERELFPPLLEEDRWVVIYILIQIVIGIAAAFLMRRQGRIWEEDS